MNKLELIHMLKNMAISHGSQKELAKALGISESYLSDVLNNNRDPGYAILSKLRLRKKVIYLPLEGANGNLEDD